MKTQKGFRNQDRADELRKAKRLDPMHKSGKERHMLYNKFEDDPEDEAILRPRPESAFDYFDDEENR